MTGRRYERGRPGELVHVDVKRVARIPDGGGWGARGAGFLRHPDPGAGTPCPRVAVDGRSGVAYAELLGDECKEARGGFLSRARALCRCPGAETERVMTDSGPGHRSRHLSDWLEAAGIGHRYTRPCNPWQNGKVELTSRMLAQGWQYARSYSSGGGCPYSSVKGSG